MARWQLIALPILATLGFASTQASRPSERLAITHAVLAPYEAVLNRDAVALCADFTPTTSADLVLGAPHESTCESAANELFASTINEHARLTALIAKLTVSDVVVHEDHATAMLEDTKVSNSGHRTMRVTFETESIALQKSEGRWLISSPATLRAINSCGTSTPPSHCTTNSRVLVFGITPTSTRHEPSLPPIPTAVRHAGGRELSDFKAGRIVYTQTGCAACHRIGDYGNARPGQNLTHIGSTLTNAEIRKAILHPSAPMPSFKNLPAAKLNAIIEFLSLLRR